MSVLRYGVLTREEGMSVGELGLETYATAPVIRTQYVCQNCRCSWILCLHCGRAGELALPGCVRMGEHDHVRCMWCDTRWIVERPEAKP